MDSYCKTIGFPQMLGAQVDIERPNNGIRYSSIEKLDDDHSADTGKTRIGSCLRDIFKISELDDTDTTKVAIQNLIGVIGELHDNVVSHSGGVGYSMAQCHPYYNYVKGNYVSFAIADSGMGFLAELKSRKIANITNDKEAIEWCIVKDNTSKRKEVDDPWAQRVPEDALVNPYGAGITTKTKDNNHQGLGLDKLVQLVTRYKGWLQIISGRSVLNMDNTGSILYSEMSSEWKGVVISLVLDANEFENQVPVQTEKEVINLMDKLRGRS